MVTEEQHLISSSERSERSYGSNDGGGESSRKSSNTTNTASTSQLPDEEPLLKSKTEDTSDEEVGLETHIEISQAGKTSTIGATFILANNLIGAGVLNFPYLTYNLGSSALMMGVHLFVLLFSTLTCVVLGMIAESTGGNTMEKIVSRVTSSPLPNLLSRISVGAFCFVQCSVYVIVIGDQSIELLEASFPGEQQCIDDHHNLYYRLSLTVLCLVLVFPMLLPRDISFLSLPSSLSAVANIYLVVVIVLQVNLPLKPLAVISDYETVLGLLNLVPVVAVSYSNQLLAPTVYWSLKKRNLTNWTLINLMSFSLTFAVYITVGVAGAWTIGEGISEDVLLSYDFQSVPMIIARVFVLLSVMMSYPTIEHTAVLLMERLYLNVSTRIHPTDGGLITPLQPAVPHASRTCHVVLTMFFFSVTLLVSYFTQRLTLLLQITGLLSIVSCYALVGFAAVKQAGQQGGKGTNTAGGLLCVGVAILTISFLFVSLFVLSWLLM